MDNRKEYLERYRKENEKKIEDTAQKFKRELGANAGKIDGLLKDNDKINSLVSGMSDSDFQKLKGVLDNPEVIDKVLSSEKAKKNLMKLLGEL